MTTSAERRKQFVQVDAIFALAGFNEADKTPDMIRQREAIIEGRMTSDEVVAEVVAEAKADAANARIKKPRSTPGL